LILKPVHNERPAAAIGRRDLDHNPITTGGRFSVAMRAPQKNRPTRNQDYRATHS
jgi:hypothetical protein